MHTMAAKFEIYQHAEREYRLRSTTANGEVVATGRSYRTAAGAHAGVEAVKPAAAAATIVEG